MEIRFQHQGGGAWQTDCALVFAFENEDALTLAPELRKTAPWLALSPALRDFDAKVDENLLVHGPAELPIPRILLIGLGKREKFSPAVLRRAAAQAMKACRERKVEHPALPAETLDGLAQPDNQVFLLEEAVMGALQGLYRCLDWLGPEKTAKLPKDPQALSILCIGNAVPDFIKNAAKKSEAVYQGLVLARNLVNGPPNQITPSRLAEEALALAGRYGFACRVMGPEEIRGLGMGAFWAVARGSREEPRFIILEHAPKGRETDAPLIFVGKGITFDTGGISLKPAAKMHEMKGDMAGAAAVLGLFEALGRRPANPPERRVIGLIPSTENMPGGGATRPGDIVQTLGGKSVEILNTDAEGRLILCDALSYAQQHWQPAFMVDIATLTGACVVALGTGAAGLFCPDEVLALQMRALGERLGERFWPMPLWEDYLDNLKSDVADLANVGPREGGAVNAALFLKEFVAEGKLWAHLDIAGPGYAEKATPLCPVGGSGFGLRTMFALATDNQLDLQTTGNSQTRGA